LTGLDRPLQRFAVGVRDHQHHAGDSVLRHDDDGTTAFLEIQRVHVDHNAPFPSRPIRISRTGTASGPLVAITSPPKAVALPFQSVKDPPASVTLGSSAAASHGDMIWSTITSARPVATRRYP